MTWSVEIHHLDVRSAGDATIIVARFTPAVGPPIVRTVLIDGGETAAADTVHGYLTALPGVARLDVIAITHYDEDHFYGILALLTRQGTPFYDNVIIYDQGQPPDESKYFRYKLDRNGNPMPTAPYQKYVAALTQKANAIRATAKVNSFDIVFFDHAHQAVIPRAQVNASWPLPPHWLIGKDIMWGNGGDGQGINPAWAENLPPGAPNPPTLKCISANKYVQQHNNPQPRYVMPKSIFDGPGRRLPQGRLAEQENKNDNAKSLGFLLEFNNFRYYVAGDLESPQEDGCSNINSNPYEFQPGVRQLVNNADNMAGRVLAMKASHHGSHSATSRDFISHLRPSAAIISCGVGNKHDHPAASTDNVLDGYVKTPTLSDVNDENRHPPAPPPPPYSPVPNYLTGYQNPNTLLGFGGDASTTAGDPRIPTRGHIRLEVSEAQSNRSVVGQVYRGIAAAATAAGSNAAAAVAEAGATHGIAVAVAVALGATVLQALAASEAAARVGDDSAGVGVVSAAFAAAGGGAAAAAVAAAAVGAANGANHARILQVGVGAALAVGAAVTGGNALAITNAAGGAVLLQNSATAAGFAAGTINTRLVGNYPAVVWNAGFAAAAAFGAVGAGANVVQAATMAAALAMSMKVGVAINGDHLYADAGEMADTVTRVAMAAGAVNAVAAQAGAVAGAHFYLGEPAEVAAATTAALIAVGAANAAVAGNNAQIAANAVNPNDLFSVQFTDVNGAQNYTHTS